MTASAIRDGNLDIWQPDITWGGGITAGIRILDLVNAAIVRRVCRGAAVNSVARDL